MILPGNDPFADARKCRRDPLRAAKVKTEYCKLTLSWFIALMCGPGCPIRNASPDVAGFQPPIPGRSSPPADPFHTFFSHRYADLNIMTALYPISNDNAA